MQLSDYLAIGSIIATIVIGVLSWVVSAYLTKKSVDKQILSYELKIEPVISKNFLEKSNSLEMYCDGQLLPEPTLLSVNIVNIGNTAIEKPPIEIMCDDSTSILPGYISDIPLGYEKLWNLERTDADICLINLEYINPGQVVKAKFFLDEYPQKTPLFKCPMKNLEVRKINSETKELLLDEFLGLEPTNLLKTINMLVKIIKITFK